MYIANNHLSVYEFVASISVAPLVARYPWQHARRHVALVSLDAAHQHLLDI